MRSFSVVQVQVSVNSSPGFTAIAIWLNIAETELSVFSKQCLKGRIDDEKTLRYQMGALEAGRNETGVTIDWLLRSKDARVKLNRIYPKPKL